MTGTLRDFCEQACLKATMYNKPGVYKDVVCLDINSMYPSGLTHLYLGPAKPYQGGRWAIVKTPDGFLFDEEAQRYEGEKYGIEWEDARDVK